MVTRESKDNKTIKIADFVVTKEIAMEYMKNGIPDIICAHRGGKILKSVFISNLKALGVFAEGLFYYAAAFALICSIIFLMPSQTLISVNTSTMLPLSVKGDS